MYESKDKILSAAILETRLYQWRIKNNKIVFTNGCFDLIHRGHIDYLEKAKALGTKLIIGLNSDESVRGIKGKGRPILDEESRARILAGLEFVSAICLFNEDTPIELIRLVKPDVLVKGDDYTVEEITGHEIVTALGGLVTTIPFLEGHSTSKIIQKIKKL